MSYMDQGMDCKRCGTSHSNFGSGVCYSCEREEAAAKRKGEWDAKTPEEQALHHLESWANPTRMTFNKDDATFVLGVFRACMALRQPGAVAKAVRLEIGVGATERGTTIVIMQPHTDGSRTLIYSGTHPMGDTTGVGFTVGDIPATTTPAAPVSQPAFPAAGKTTPILKKQPPFHPFDKRISTDEVFHEITVPVSQPAAQTMVAIDWTELNAFDKFKSEHPEYLNHNVACFAYGHRAGCAYSAANQPAAQEPDCLNMIVRDVAELDYSSDLLPDLMAVTEADLRAIIARHTAPQPLSAPAGSEQEVTDAMVDAYIRFAAKTGYLSHPDVPYRGTQSGDSEAAWHKRLAAEAIRVALAAQQEQSK